MSLKKASKRIYLSPPHMSGHELEFINDAFNSNWIAPLGPHVDAFEREIADYTGVSGALALCSGTAAIHLALRVLQVSVGDRVFCSSLTFVASANPILYLGAEPVFIDSEPETWNMSPFALERALNEAKQQNRLPKAVIIVNLYGQSANMDQLTEICNRYDIPIVEDAAESLGATFKNKPSGSIGKFGVFSFNGNKIITTSGGGALISNDTEALDKARYWASQAKQPVRHYEHSEVGFNYRLSNVLAAIGRGQLTVLEERIQARKDINQRYYNHLGNIDGINFLLEADYGRSTQWLTAVTFDESVCRVSTSDLISTLDDLNIEARPVWKPLHLQPLFKRCTYYSHEETVDVSANLFEKGLCLPSGSNMTVEDQMLVIENIRSYLGLV